MFLKSILILSFLFFSTAQAEVTFRSPTGFSVKRELFFQRTKPADVYQSYMNIGSWWLPGHTWSGNAQNLFFDIYKMALIEILPEKGFVKHGDIVFLKKNALIRMNSALGPLQHLGVSGTLSIVFEDVAGGTKVTKTYNVSGTIDGDLGCKWADGVDSVMGQQLDQFQKFVREKKDQ